MWGRRLGRWSARWCEKKRTAVEAELTSIENREALQDDHRSPAVMRDKWLLIIEKLFSHTPPSWDLAAARCASTRRFRNRKRQYNTKYNSSSYHWAQARCQVKKKGKVHKIFFKSTHHSNIFIICQCDYFHHEVDPLSCQGCEISRK